MEKLRQRRAVGGWLGLEGQVRFLLRVFSLIFLAAATIAGTIDSIRSVAATVVVMTSLSDAWQGTSPSTFEKFRSAISPDGSNRLYEPAVQWLLAQPAFAIFLAIALLMWMAAYRRVPRAGRFAT